MKFRQLFKTIVVIIGVISFKLFFFYYCIVTFDDLRNLRDGYFVIYVARERRLIERRPCVLSENRQCVFEGNVDELDVYYNRRWILVKTRPSQYFVIDKSMDLKEIIREPIDPNLRRRLREPDYYIYTTNVIGPMDSIAFVHFQDSIGFVPHKYNRWRDKPRERRDE